MVRSYSCHDSCKLQAVCVNDVETVDVANAGAIGLTFLVCTLRMWCIVASPWEYRPVAKASNYFLCRPRQVHHTFIRHCERCAIHPTVGSRRLAECVLQGRGSYRIQRTRCRVVIPHWSGLASHTSLTSVVASHATRAEIRSLMRVQPELVRHAACSGSAHASWSASIASTTPCPTGDSRVSNEG